MVHNQGWDQAAPLLLVPVRRVSVVRKDEEEVVEYPPKNLKFAMEWESSGNHSRRRTGSKTPPTDGTS